MIISNVDFINGHLLLSASTLSSGFVPMFCFALRFFLDQLNFHHAIGLKIQEFGGYLRS